MPNEEEILAARTAQGGWKERLVEESRLQGFRLGRTAGDYHGQQ